MNKTAALELVTKGNGKLPEIVTAALSPTESVRPEAFDIVPAPVKPDLRVLEAVHKAVVRAAEVEPLTVTERRQLEQSEIDTLMAERHELDALEAYIKARKAAHRTMVFNHLDLEVEEAETAVDLDPKGHYLADGEARASNGHRFTRELRHGAPVLTAEALQEVVESGAVPESVFSHEDYLACTTQVRVLDEEKTLLHLRKNPDSVQALSAAAVPGRTTASLNRRK